MATIYYKEEIGLIALVWKSFVKRYESVLTTNADVRSIEVLIGINKYLK